MTDVTDSTSNANADLPAASVPAAPEAAPAPQLPSPAAAGEGSGEGSGSPPHAEEGLGERSAPAAAKPATPPARARRIRRARPPRRRRTALRTTLLLVLAFIVVGVAPLALSARVFHRSLLDGVPGLSGLLAPVELAATATPDDLALPRAAWVAQATAVRAGAASGATIANLAPGFPVTLVAHAATDAGTWDHINWSGPTAASGGEGWAPDAALTAVPGQGPVVGDAGALSPALAATLERVGGSTGLAVYYPGQHRLYLTNGDERYPLGDGARALLVTALLAAPVPTPAPDQIGPSAMMIYTAIAGRVAQNDAIFAALAYQQIGGAPGLVRQLAAMGVSGVQPGAADWQATQATPRALAHYYTLLAGLEPAVTGAAALSANVRTRTLAMLAPDAATMAYAGLGQSLPAGASVSIVLGSSHDAGGWSANASAIVTTGAGLTYVAVLCARGLPSADSGTAALRTVLEDLATLAQT